MGTCQGSKTAETGTGNIKAAQNIKQISGIQAQIDRLKADNVALMQADYTGRKSWGGQLQSQVNKAASNNRKIEKLERQIKKLQKGETKPEKKAEKKAAPSWRRAGEGWYVGEKGHEIRENYDTGGYDIVKISGNTEKTVKHFDKLSEAKKYKVR